MKNRMIAWAFAALLAQAATAEVRTWTGSTGSQITAELVEEIDGKVVLREKTGRELRVPRSFLSEADIEYLDSQIVPVLGVKPDIKVESVFKPDSGVVQVVKYSIEVRKVSSYPYDSPVNVSLYLIGVIGADKTHVVLQRTQEQIRFTAGNRNALITGPDLSLGSPEIQKKYEVDYIGHLVVVSTSGGRIIEVKSDNKMLTANAGSISKFETGDIFDSDMKLIE